MQAQIHAPFADLTPVPCFLDQLAEELKRRMSDADITGGLPALSLLSAMLFGRPGPGAASNGAAMTLAHLSGSALKAALKLPAPGFGMGLQVGSPPSLMPRQHICRCDVQIASLTDSRSSISSPYTHFGV